MKQKYLLGENTKIQLLYELITKKSNGIGKDDPVKYLGIHFDGKLTWKIRIKKKLIQGYARMKILYPLLNHSSTLRMECSLLLDTAVIRSLLTCACPVCSSCLPNKNLKPTNSTKRMSAKWAVKQ